LWEVAEGESGSTNLEAELPLSAERTGNPPLFASGQARSKKICLKFKGSACE